MFSESLKRVALCAVLVALPQVVVRAACAADAPAKPAASRPVSPQQAESLSKAAELDARAAELSRKIDREDQALQKIIGPEHVGSVDASTETLLADEVHLEVDKAGLTARRDALADAVARLKAEVPHSAADMEMIAALNRQLVETGVTLAETVARLDFVRARLRSIHQARDVLSEMQVMQRERLRAETDAATYRQQAE